jgi:hypothetical protein
MHNGKGLRQKGYVRSHKTMCREREENIIFGRTEGNKFCFRSKYRPPTLLFTSYYVFKTNKNQLQHTF